MRFLCLCLCLFMASTVFAGSPVILDVPDGVYVLEVAKGMASVTPATKVVVGPIDVPDVPIVTPPANLDVKKAIAAVSDPDKDLHLRAMTFAMNMVAGQVANSNRTVAESVAAVKEFVNTAAMGADWSPFWNALDPHLKACASNRQLSAMLVSVQKAMEAEIPDSGGEVVLFGGLPTYGMEALDPEFWKNLLQMLLPLLLKFLTLL